MPWASFQVPPRGSPGPRRGRLFRGPGAAVVALGLAPGWAFASRRRPVPPPGRRPRPSGWTACATSVGEVALGDDRLDLAELRASGAPEAAAGPVCAANGWKLRAAGTSRRRSPRVGKKGTATRMAAGDVPRRTRASRRPPTARAAAAPCSSPRWKPTAGPGASWTGPRTAGCNPGPPRTGSPGSSVPTRERGLGWLAFLGDLGLGACLADDMGLGKTAQPPSLLVDERALSPRPTGPTLVVCPMSLVGQLAARDGEPVRP